MYLYIKGRAGRVGAGEEGEAVIDFKRYEGQG
jgi:hypothetical protein